MRNYALVLLALSAAACSGSAGEASRQPDTPASQPNGATVGIDSSAATSRVAASGAQDAARASAGRRTIMFAGTSLTAGLGLEPDSAYPAHVQRMIDSAKLGYEVMNVGVSGETSSALLRRLDWLLREPFAVFVIETGANDGLRGIPVSTMSANIQQIIERIRAVRPDARIALAQMEAPPNMGADYTRRFRQVYPDLAKRNGVTLLPFILEGVAGERALNQGDGIHPNNAGARIVARNVWKGLRPLLQ